MIQQGKENEGIAGFQVQAVEKGLAVPARAGNRPRGWRRTGRTGEGSAGRFRVVAGGRWQVAFTVGPGVGLRGAVGVSDRRHEKHRWHPRYCKTRRSLGMARDG